MGCSGDVYKSIKQKYPQQLPKYIVSEEIKKELKEKTELVQMKVSRQADLIKKEQEGQLASSEKESAADFYAIRDRIDEQYLGGVKALEQVKGEKIEDIVGLNKTNEEYSKVKKQMQSKFADEEKALKKEIDKVKQEQSQKAGKDVQEIQELKGLPQNVKQLVYDQGLVEYHNVITEQSSSFFKGFDERLNVDSLTSHLKNILPENKLRTIRQQSKEQMEKVAGQIAGDPSEGHAVLF